MIKNLLYSLFLHFLFLLVIYSSFSTPEFDENKANEISVSLITISGKQDSSILKPLEKPSEVTTPKPEEKKEEKPKPQKKVKAKKVKPKEIKSINQKTTEEKNSLPEIADLEEPKEQEEETLEEDQEITDESLS